MKQYDHEPKISELFEQLEDEFAYVPQFIPKIENVPEEQAKMIELGIKKDMVNNMINLLFT